MFLLLLIISWTSCISTHEKSIIECLGVETNNLLKEGSYLFEEMLVEYYPSDNITSSYKSYFRDLAIASEKLEVIESNKKTKEFVEKLKRLNKLNLFYQKNKNSDYQNSINEKDSIYYINTGKYLDCLRKAAFTEDFKSYFDVLKLKEVTVYPAVVAGSLLKEESIVMKRDMELFRIYIAFHFYYEMMLNNESIK